MVPLKDLFQLCTDITSLNFGSFGACPLPVFNAYQSYQQELEEEPVQFFLSKGPQYLRHSREALAKYLNAQAEDLVYVTNPSYGVNIVAKSLRLEPGDEILTTAILDRLLHHVHLVHIDGNAVRRTRERCEMGRCRHATQR